MTKIFLAAVDQNATTFLPLIRRLKKCYFNLFSFYYLKSPATLKYFQEISKYSVNTLIDRGAHSFQKGAKVNYDTYLKQYIKFIENYDFDNCLGYFELDVDNIIGVDAVTDMTAELKEVSNKIIPVWHPVRGVKNFKEMCKTEKYVSISGWNNEDIKDKDFHLFVNYAHKHNTKIHGLGLTREKVIRNTSFDSVDSSSWKAPARYGKLNNKKVSKECVNKNDGSFYQYLYLRGMRLQEKYATKEELGDFI